MSHIFLTEFADTNWIFAPFRFTTYNERVQPIRDKQASVGGINFISDN